MGASFDSSKEFKEVIDRVFAMMDEDPDMGPKLRDADVPMRYEFEDVDLVANIRAARDDEDGNLHWEWTDDVDWEPRVKMAMSSETANKYFQGKENVAMAIARRRIKSSGDVKAALSLMPMTKPVFASIARCSRRSTRTWLSDPRGSVDRGRGAGRPCSTNKAQAGKWRAVVLRKASRPSRTPPAEAAGRIARQRRGLLEVPPLFFPGSAARG